jgi:hypothetical protein
MSATQKFERDVTVAGWSMPSTRSLAASVCRMSVIASSTYTTCSIHHAKVSLHVSGDHATALGAFPQG